MKDSNTPQQRVKERDAASYIGMSVPFLRLSRCNGGGPPYLRMGRAIRYDIADLDKWLDSRRVRG
jgi:predicted DNA-binding transcriptional regulator AlpA